MRRATLRRGIPAAAALAVAALLLAGCSSATSGLVDDYNAGDLGGDYISGDGAVRTIAPENREPASDWAGPSTEGGELSSAELRGEVVVLNFWYAACPPCRAEAADLEALHQRFADEPVAFVGVNVSDGLDTANAFNAEHGVSYPSILDAAGNDVLLAFSGAVSANAVPTTLVLDREGRVAARFSGLITSPGLIADLVEQTLAEG